MFWGEALSIFCFTSTKGGHFRPKSIGLGNHEAEMLLLVSLCRLGIKIPFPMGSEQTQTVLGAKQTQWV